jgi:hypothetical protein
MCAHHLHVPAAPSSSIKTSEVSLPLLSSQHRSEPHPYGWTGTRTPIWTRRNAITVSRTVFDIASEPNGARSAYFEFVVFDSMWHRMPPSNPSWIVPHGNAQRQRLNMQRQHSMYYTVHLTVHRFVRKEHPMTTFLGCRVSAAWAIKSSNYQIL